MHEMSLAMGVMDIARRTVSQHPGATLTAVELTVGELAGVEIETFSTALRCAVASSPWPEARLNINIAEARGVCVDCGRDFHATALFGCCPGCGSAACALTSGTELKVNAIRLSVPEPPEAND